MLSLTYEHLKEEVFDRFNELVISSDLNISRLVGISDTPDDYYYILKNTNGKNQKYSYLSAVGRLVYLKDTMSYDDYLYVNSIAEINGCESESEFIERKTTL